jgi:hypothetical protein
MKQTLITLVLFCCAWGALGKGGPSLSGRVTDDAGRPLTNVRVVLRIAHASTGGRLLQTSADGTYSFGKLEPGDYEAVFSLNGYEGQHITAIHADKEALLLNVQLHKSGAWGSSIVSHRYVAEVRTNATPGGRTLRKAYSHDLKGPHKAISGGDGVTVHSYKAIEAEPGSPRGESYRTEIAAAPPVGTASKVSESGALKMGDEAVAAYGATAAAAPDAHAGMLTSGEINDFSKWTLWEDMSMDALKGYRSTWPFRPEARYTVLVKSKNGMPLCNAHVKMSGGSGQVWEAVTDNTGKAELWYGMWNMDMSTAHSLSASVEYGRERFPIPTLKPFSEGVNILPTNLACLNPAKLDIAFIVDATGSMSDEINYLKAELRDILQKVHDSMPAIQVQTGALFYRDLSDEYVTRISDLTPDFEKTEAFIADNRADGGGDFPEAVDAALEEGLNGFHWNADATARLAFLVLDAPPHDDAATVKHMQELTARYAAMGIRIIPVVCSGSDKPMEYLMRSIALATNGTYLFLTDHSGIGGSHTAPTTDKYDVEYLNGLIYRVIYRCVYIPSCSERQAAQTDTANVQQKTDSVTINWRYYPNPTTGILHIQHTHTSGYLLITDVTGKAIMRVPADISGMTTIDLGQYPAGMYAIRYNWADDKWVSGKFVLIH